MVNKVKEILNKVKCIEVDLKTTEGRLKVHNMLKTLASNFCSFKIEDGDNPLAIAYYIKNKKGINIGDNSYSRYNAPIHNYYNELKIPHGCILIKNNDECGSISALTVDEFNKNYIIKDKKVMKISELELIGYEYFGQDNFLEETIKDLVIKINDICKSDEYAKRVYTESNLNNFIESAVIRKFKIDKTDMSSMNEEPSIKIGDWLIVSVVCGIPTITHVKEFEFDNRYHIVE